MVECDMRAIFMPQTCLKENVFVYNFISISNYLASHLWNNFAVESLIKLEYILDSSLGSMSFSFLLWIQHSESSNKMVIDNISYNFIFIVLFPLNIA